MGLGPKQKGPSPEEIAEQNQLNAQLQAQSRQLAIQKRQAQRTALMSLAAGVGGQATFSDLPLPDQQLGAAPSGQNGGLFQGIARQSTRGFLGG